MQGCVNTYKHSISLCTSEPFEHLLITSCMHQLIRSLQLPASLPLCKGWYTTLYSHENDEIHIALTAQRHIAVHIRIYVYAYTHMWCMLACDTTPHMPPATVA